MFPSRITVAKTKVYATESPIGQITLPPEIASEIPAGEPLRIVVMWELSNFDRVWRAAGRQRFEAAYSPEDSVYEQLMDDSAIR